MTLQQLKYADAVASCGSISEAARQCFVTQPTLTESVRALEELDAYPYITYEQGVENALYFAEEVMPAIDRKKNIRVRDRATMTNLILGLNGFTVASGVHAKAYNPSIVSIPLKLDDAITVGVISRAGIPHSPAARAFIESMRRIIASSGK